MTIPRALTPLLLALGLLAAGCGPEAPVHELVQAAGGEISIPLSRVGDGEVHFFTYRHDGKNVNFLIRTDGSGKLQAHLDACFSCYRYRRGYVVEGDDLVCIACRLAYSTEDEVWDFIGACAPISVHSTIEANSLVIKDRLLVRAAKYF